MFCYWVAIGLLMDCIVVHQILTLARKSYSREFDTFGIVVPVLACVGGALVFHAVC